MQRPRHWSQRNPLNLYSTADNLRVKAGKIADMAHTRKARAYAPYLSGQKLSNVRTTGGHLGDVLVDMLAMREAGDCHGVELYLSLVQGVRDALLSEPGDARELTLVEQEANAREDAASLRYLNGGCANELLMAALDEISIERRRVAALVIETSS